MFGILFEENGETGDRRSVGRNANSVMAQGACGETADALPPERCKLTGLCGIENQGATCYLNSLLQTLLFTPEFRDALFKLGPDELGNLEDCDKPQSKVRVIPIQLQRLFAGLLLSDQKEVSTVELTTSFGWTNNEEVQQHDAQELNRILFSAIENSLIGTAGNSLISDLFHGTVVNQIVCDVCGRVSEREEDFLDLTVAVANKQSLERSLNDAFVEIEVMNERNQYACEYCGGYVDAKKGAKIRKLPPILTLSLLRFSYDFEKGERYKETGRFSFPIELNMRPYYEQASSEECTLYDLYSVVIHKGSGYGGHYHAYIKDVEHLGTWNYTEEEKENIDAQQHTHRDKRQKTISKPPETCRISRFEPKDIIVNILLTQPDYQTSIDILCREIMNVTGSSWNKKFKKNHGSITKFLDHHNSMFFYNKASTVVMLIDGYAFEQSLLNMENSSVQAADPRPANNDQVNGHMEVDLLHGKNDVKKNYEHNIEAWFDINDGSIKPIPAKQIERMYAGKESAYMLFYRKKSLQRPVEALSNPKYCVPKPLQDKIRSQNEEYNKKREEYDSNVNTLQIHLLFGKNHEVVNGALQAVTGTLSHMDVTFDRRKPLSEFHKFIATLGVADLMYDEYNLSIAAEFPAGLHLYSDLNKENHSKSLFDLGVQNGSNIFLWNGIEVGGTEVLIGPLHEPIALQISVFLRDETHLESFSGFPQSLTLSGLHLAVAEQLHISANGLRLIQIICDDNTPLELKEREEDATLQEIGLLDGYHVLFDYYTPSGQTRCLICITVESRCKLHDPEPRNCSKVVEVDKEATIRDLKTLALFKLNLDPNRQYYIQTVQNFDDLNPPLHDHKKLSEANLTNGCRVVITEGKLLTENDVMLTVQLPPSRASEEFQVIWDQTKTLGELVGFVVNQKGLEVGNSWHLCRTNWCREVTEVIENMEAAVRELQINHGDHLVLETGDVSNPNEVTFIAWLYTTPEPYSLLAQSSSHRNINIALKDIDSSVGRIHIDVVTTKADNSLEQLKADLRLIINNTLPPGNHLPPERSPSYLRLRLLEDGRPGRVLRGRADQLRKHKLRNQADLCIQILDHEEDLSQSMLVILVAERCPEPGVYTVPRELIIDVTEVSDVQILASIVADSLMLDPTNLLLAKHVAERFDWLPITDQPTQQRDSTVRRKKTAKKSFLKFSPYFLRDGDLIGVIDKSKVMDEDFSTQLDVEGKQRMLEEAEIKRQARLAKGLNSPMDEEPKKRERRPEVGIKIFVGDFS